MSYWRKKSPDEHKRDAVNLRALPYLPAMAKRWLPEGKLYGDKWQCKSPHAPPESSQGLTVYLSNGTWVDYATDEAGRGAVSLAAYIAKISEAEALEHVSRMLDVPDEHA